MRVNWMVWSKRVVTALISGTPFKNCWGLFSRQVPGVMLAWDFCMRLLSGFCIRRLTHMCQLRLIIYWSVHSISILVLVRFLFVENIGLISIPLDDVKGFNIELCPTVQQILQNRRLLEPYMKTFQEFLDKLNGNKKIEGMAYQALKREKNERTMEF